MSKILRRPMFRGGPVDSYGTGIASGLADGGRVGYKRGQFVTGSELMQGASDAQKLYGNLYSSKGPRGMGKNTGVTGKWAELYGTTDFQEGDKPDLSMNYTIPDTTVAEDLIDTTVLDTSTGSDAEENQPEVAEEQIAGITTVDKGPVNEVGKLLGAKAEPLEISVEDQITQQAELFDKLFSKNMEAKNKERLKKARIQDISDVGLDIFARSTKPGADVKTMLGEAAERMVDKPSRTEVLQAKIDDQGDKRYQTSVALAVNDYIAGKRSKEKIEEFKKGKDYESGLKMQLSIPQKTDTFEEAKFKLTVGGISPTSPKGLKFLIGIKDDTPMADNVVSVSGIKIAELTDPGKTNKIIKKLKPGYNILDDDGVKRIILYDGSGTAAGIDVMTVSEFWSKK